jgi:Uma2 family endonuclease
MSAITTIPPVESSPDEERGVMRDVSWQFYDRLTNALSAEAHIRVAYDGKDLEIMTLGPKHEKSKEALGIFIYEVSVGLEIDFEPMGSTTWKRLAALVGVESDLCYYFDPSKIRASDKAVAEESNDVNDYPNPDLAVEVDISPPKVDRPKIYRSLQVGEIWRFADSSILIEQLGEDGWYAPATASRFLFVRADEVTRWITDRKSSRIVDWRRRLQNWIQGELKARVEFGRDHDAERR